MLGYLLPDDLRKKPVASKDSAGKTILLTNEPEQQMTGIDESVAERSRFLDRQFEDNLDQLRGLLSDRGWAMITRRVPLHLEAQRFRVNVISQEDFSRRAVGLVRPDQARHVLCPRLLDQRAELLGASWPSLGGRCR